MSNEPTKFINLRNERYFPRAKDIPVHKDSNQDLFIPAEVTVPCDYTNRLVPNPPARRLRHWCTLSGCTCAIWNDKMRIGEKTWGMIEYDRDPEACYLEGMALCAEHEAGGENMTSKMPSDQSQGCVAIMYTVDRCDKVPNPHLGWEASNELLIPNAASVKIFRCTIQELITINDEFHQRVKDGCLDLCVGCSRPAKSRCQRCKSSYCSKKCQVADWMSHKKECEVIEQIRDWSKLDWDKYEGPYTFKN